MAIEGGADLGAAWRVGPDLAASQSRDETAESWDQPACRPRRLPARGRGPGTNPCFLVPRNCTPILRGFTLEIPQLVYAAALHRCSMPQPLGPAAPLARSPSTISAWPALAAKRTRESQSVRKSTGGIRRVPVQKPICRDALRDRFRFVRRPAVRHRVRARESPTKPTNPPGWSGRFVAEATAEASGSLEAGRGALGDARRRTVSTIHSLCLCNRVLTQNGHRKTCFSGSNISSSLVIWRFCSWRTTRATSDWWASC